MSALLGMLAFAVLFAVFCLLPARHCGSCGGRGEDPDGARCAGCPHAPGEGNFDHTGVTP